jgi:hypothetical protein
MLEVIGVVLACLVDGVEGLLRDERGYVFVALFRRSGDVGLLGLRGRHCGRGRRMLRSRWVVKVAGGGRSFRLAAKVDLG